MRIPGSYLHTGAIEPVLTRDGLPERGTNLVTLEGSQSQNWNCVVMMVMMLMMQVERSDDAERRRCRCES